MQYVCDAPDGATWFRFETEAEAEAEAALMRHAVDKYYRRHEGAARESYRAPKTAASFEQAIGLKDHIAKAMPLFLTLRAADGEGLATAMLPPGGRNQVNFRIVIVGPENADPYEAYEPAIEALAQHFNIELPRETCFLTLKAYLACRLRPLARSFRLVLVELAYSSPLAPYR